MAEHRTYIPFNGQQVLVGTHVRRPVRVYFPNGNKNIYLPEGTRVTIPILNAIQSLPNGTSLTATRLQQLLNGANPINPTPVFRPTPVYKPTPVSRPTRPFLFK
jgi:hypothetical protein